LGLDSSFPGDYPDQQAVTDYLTDERDQFVDFVAQRPTRRDLRYELDADGTTYQSGSPGLGTKSLVFEVYSETGGAHPVTCYQAFSYDLGKGARITFDTLFKPGTKPLDVISLPSAANCRGGLGQSRCTAETLRRTGISRSPTTR
jgi:hypothetical protein